jgi:hypothetical protein
MRSVWSGRALRAVGAISLVSGLLLGLVVAPASAVGICGSSNGISICVSAPDGQLSGDVPIAVTVNGSVSDIKEMIFQWGPSTSSTTQLLTDYEPPFGFTWRTDQYLDVTQFLNVRLKRLDDSIGGPVSLQLTLENGNDTSVPQNPNDWQQMFQPRSFTGDPVIAAVGDGGDGTVRSDEVAASILGSQAAILLYLGDLAYERGTPAELDANFGRSAFEPGGGVGWGKLSRFTRPTLGNHEVFNLAAWRNYWHGRPDWETFVFGGVRFLNLNSECASVGGCGSQSAQYAFVQSVLSTNTHECVVAYWHRPVLSSVDDNAEMRPIWALLADGGGDLVLNGHTHDMEAYAPLNASLEAGGPDAHMVELVSGAGGHYLTGVTDTDPRGVWQATKVAGAAYITAVGGGNGDATRLDWAFRDRSGGIVSGTGGQGTGSVECADVPDTTAEVFSDDFSTGNFSRWSGVTNLSIDANTGGIAPPSARGQVTGTRAWAYRTLSSTHADLCQAMRVNLASIGANSVDLLRLRTGSDGPVARVYVNSARTLWIRADASGQQLSTSRQLPSGWNTLELCATVGTAGSLTLKLNGAVIAGPWTANLGTVAIGRIQIGDTTLRSWSANFDDVVVTS